MRRIDRLRPYIAREIRSSVQKSHSFLHSTPTTIISSAVMATPSEPRRRARFYSTKTFRFLAMLSLTFSFFIVELVVGNITNSLALVADAFHMLSDVIALIIGLLAIRIAKRRSNINTYGWVRAEVVGANINTVFLLALCLTIVFDTIKRFIQPEPIVNVNLLLIVGSVGLGINIIGLFLFQGFHGHTHGGGAHGHSHSAAESSKSTETPVTTTMEIGESATGVQRKHTTITVNSHDIEPVETIVGSSKVKRHSLRALDEVCTLTCLSLLRLKTIFGVFYRLLSIAQVMHMIIIRLTIIFPAVIPPLILRPKESCARKLRR